MDPYTARLIQIESSGNPYAVTGRNYGLGQFGPAEMRRYGITDWRNPDQQLSAIQRERGDITRLLQNKLGRDPTPAEVYLTHQQGFAGGPALLNADPNTPAWQALAPYYKSDRIARSAISGNIPNGHPLKGVDPGSVTAGQFRDLWLNKFNRGGGNATQLAMAMQRNPLQPVAQPANPFDSIPRPGAPAPTPGGEPTFGHSADAIAQAKAAGVWNPPKGFPELKPLANDPSSQQQQFAGLQQPAQPPDPFQSIPQPAMTQPQMPPTQVASAPPAPSLSAPSTGTGDSSDKSGLSGMAGNFGKIAKAFGADTPAPKVEMPPPPQVQFPVAPGLAQARALAMAMAMRPLMPQGQG